MILAALLALTSPTIELDAVGDVMLARGVERRIEREGPDAPFRAVSRVLRHADIAVGNLECVLGDAPFAIRKAISLRAKPGSASGLRRAGFSLLTLANNHSLDCGSPGLCQTEDTLRRLGLATTGTSLAPTLLIRKGIKIAFFGACQFHPDPNSVKIALNQDIVYADDPSLTRAIESAKKQADIVVVLIHWGEEQNPQPTAIQQDFAKRFAESGADLILGCHPHVLQPTGWLTTKSGRRCLVSYSLGNFVFDAPHGPDLASAILRVRMSKEQVVGFSQEPATIRAAFPTLAKP